MDAYFGDLNEGTQVIADDVKNHGPDEATHDKHLIQVLNQCRKVSLKLNAEKSIFKAESIPFFGHVISRDGIKPDPKKNGCNQNNDDANVKIRASKFSWSVQLFGNLHTKP